MAMDELEVSKIFGAGCAALLAFVGFGQLGSALVGVDQLDEPAYIVEVPETEEAGAAIAEIEVMPIGQLMAMAEIEDGPKVFRKCAACHKVEDGGANGVGPNLYGVVGRDIGGVEGFGYSTVLAEKDGIWDFAALDGFLEAPKKWAPGTKMGFVGLSKPGDRASVIAWLNEQSAAPLAMPAVEEAAAPEAEAPAETEMAAVETPEAAAEEPAAAEVVAEEPAATETAEAAVPETEAPVVAEPEVAEQVEEPAATETAEATAAAPAAAASVAAFMIGADAEKGAKVFRKCKACHKVEAGAGNAVGPNLHNVVGRDIAALDGFKYSDALMGKDGVWDFENLSAFLTKPKDWVKGTKMAFPGLRKEEDRAAVIAYLNAQSDNPLPLPE